MASNDVLSAILHYKRNIDKISDPPERALKYEDRLLHCINKLYRLPVNVNHLQETGIGKTVNALRKIEGEKGLGDAAKALVAKWKTMVMLEDEAERKQREEVCSGPKEEDMKRIKLIREAEKSQSKTDSLSKSQQIHHSESHKSKSHEGDRKHRTDSSEGSKDRKRKHDHDDSKHHSKSSKKRMINSDESDNFEEQEKHSPDYSSSKSSKSSISSKSSEKVSNKELVSPISHETSKRERKKEHKSSSSGASSSSSKYSHDLSPSSSSHERNDHRKSNTVIDDDGGIDSQSGASFADALGPMVLKKTKKKNAPVSATSSPALSETNSESSSTKVKKQSSKQIDINRPPVDLEPLEPDLIATLPVPTPYYKPNPIYHLPPAEASRRRIQAEEDALNTMMSNKNQRTKVYSGIKSGFAYVPTLYEFCCRVLQQHIDALEYTGGIPYSLLKPVLDGATPAQLFQFEHFNPYIIEDTDHLWKFHVNKEFRNESRQEFESWRDMYLRCIDEREERYKAVTANIQKSIEKATPVRKAKLAYIDVAKPPRNILRKQIKNGTSKPEAARLLGKNDPDAVRVAPPKQPTVKEVPSIKLKPKVAPLMQKTLKSIKMTRFKR